MKKFEEATEWADLLGKGNQSLKYVLRDERLPHTFINQTLRYLREINIENVISATESC